MASGRVVGPVPVGLGHWSHDDVLSLVLWEPGGKDVEILLGLLGPGWKPFLHGVLGETETDEIVVLHILRCLEVSHSSHSIIESVLKKYGVRLCFVFFFFNSCLLLYILPIHLE